MDFAKKILGGIFFLIFLLVLLPMQLVAVAAVVYVISLVFARYFWPKIFFRKTGDDLTEVGKDYRRAVFDQLGLFPVIDPKSHVQTGYIFLDEGIYVLVAPKSVLREGEEETQISTHATAAAECGDYGATWRLLTYDEGLALSNKLIEAAEELNYTTERTGSKILTKLAGKRLTKTYQSIFGPLLYGTTAPEDRHGEDVVFSYGVDFDVDESGMPHDPEKVIKRISEYAEGTLTVCANLEELKDEDEFIDSVEIKGLDGAISDILLSKAIYSD